MGVRDGRSIGRELERARGISRECVIDIESACVRSDIGAGDDMESMLV